MPSVTPAHIALRDRLRDAIRETLQLNDRLEDVIAVKSTRPGSFHGKVDHSQPPWCAPVANAVTDLHSMSREMEAWLRLSQQLPPRRRGGSSENTRRALENVARLAEAAQDATVRGHTRDLNRWQFRASVALGETERPVRLPRARGEPVRHCPWCRQDTLRMLPLRGAISCMYRECRDEEGRHPKGTMTFSAVVGDWVVIWQDGVAGLP